MKKDNKLEGMNLETYKNFYLLAQCVFVSTINYRLSPIIISTPCILILEWVVFSHKLFTVYSA